VNKRYEAQLTRSRGTITVGDNALHYDSSWFGEWELEFTRLRVIAEKTDQSGPWGEDWYFVFVLDDGTSYNMSVYADGSREAAAVAAEAIGPELPDLTLFGSASIQDRVMSPEPLRGKHLYRYTTTPAPWWRRWFAGSFDYYLTAEIIEYLGIEDPAPGDATWVDQPIH